MDSNVKVFQSFEKLSAHKEVETCFSAALMEFTIRLSKVFINFSFLLDFYQLFSFVASLLNLH